MVEIAHELRGAMVEISAIRWNKLMTESDAEDALEGVDGRGTVEELDSKIEDLEAKIEELEEELKRPTVPPPPRSFAQLFDSAKAGVVEPPGPKALRPLPRREQYCSQCSVGHANRLTGLCERHGKRIKLSFP